MNDRKMIREEELRKVMGGIGGIGIIGGPDGPTTIYPVTAGGWPKDNKWRDEQIIH